MPRQLGDPPFADEEKLYRRLNADWIDSHGRVRDAAIDLLGTSVDRGLFGGPQECLARAGADIVAVGAIAFGDIPSRFDAPPAASYESVVVYEPEHGNDAHSEIQFWRAGDSGPTKPKSNPMKAQIREQLAARLVVHRREDSGI